MESQGKQIVISITFANFYRTDVYPGNDEKRAEQNRNGLRLLRDNGVKLRLLCGEEEWTTFLNDGQLVSLDEYDKETCRQPSLIKGEKIGKILIWITTRKYWMFTNQKDSHWIRTVNWYHVYRSCKFATHMPDITGTKLT